MVVLLQIWLVVVTILLIKSAYCRFICCSISLPHGGGTVFTFLGKHVSVVSALPSLKKQLRTASLRQAAVSCRLMGAADCAAETPSKVKAVMIATFICVALKGLKHEVLREAERQPTGVG
jgi:hypothetical protein